MGIFKLNGVDYMGGGGGGDNSMELTYDEYIALPEEEKTNGTTYYIKDINGAGKDQFQPIIYSEEEREIGVWTNGKPLYQKTIYLGTITKDTNWHYLPHGIDNIDKIVSCEGIMGETNSTVFTPIPNYRPSYSMGICIEVNQTDIAYMQNWIDSPSDQTYVTVRYTKTTDTPGSGTWTPQGVPAVHYDGNEKVVGTWFGETLYEKTIQLSSTLAMETVNTWVDSGIDISYVDKLISFEVMTSDGTSIPALWCGKGNNHLTLLTSRGNTFTGLYFTLRYTKTT